MPSCLSPFLPLGHQLIVDAYYTRWASWFSIDRLRLEQQGGPWAAPEPPHVLAGHADIIFATLELISPQVRQLILLTLTRSL